MTNQPVHTPIYKLAYNVTVSISYNEFFLIKPNFKQKELNGKKLYYADGTPAVEDVGYPYIAIIDGEEFEYGMAKNEELRVSTLSGNTVGILQFRFTFNVDNMEENVDACIKKAKYKAGDAFGKYLQVVDSSKLIITDVHVYRYNITEEE